MAARAPVAPPQLDEFLLGSDDRWRAADRQALGWTEASLFRRP